MQTSIFSKRHEFRKLYQLYKSYEIQNNKLHHILYKTTNLINGKIYIGRHSTNNLEDGYLGSGRKLLEAINKYGEFNFKRVIIKFLPDFESLCALEKLILTQDYLAQDSNYNIGFGGYGLGTHSDETKNLLKSILKTKSKLISERTKQAVCTPKSRKANSLRQLSLPDEVKKFRADRSREVRQTPESRMNTSKALKNAYKNNPNLALAHKDRHNRPWKVRNQYMDLTNARFKVIDKVYDIYISYDFSVKGSVSKFEEELKSVFNFYPTRAIYSYLKKHGNPRKDKDWLLWMGKN